MQIPDKKAPSRDLNKVPSCCEATVLPTAPPYHPYSNTCTVEENIKVTVKGVIGIRHN
uniref:Uncharacterized protein n=1 Tax=Anguilla anguilla TaxID=7936 RepID=A0A0E9TP24_ANGAN